MCSGLRPAKAGFFHTAYGHSERSVYYEMIKTKENQRMHGDGKMNLRDLERKRAFFIQKQDTLEGVLQMNGGKSSKIAPGRRTGR